MTSILKVDTIQTSSGVTQWFTDPPRFHIKKTAQQTGLTDNTENTVTWDQAEIDSVSGFDDTNDRYVVGQTGTYSLYANIAFYAQNGATLRDGFAWIEKSSDSGSTWTPILSGGCRFSTNDAHGDIVSFTGMHSLSSGDYLRVVGYLNNTDSTTWSIVDQLNVMQSGITATQNIATSFGGYRIA